LDGNKSGLDSGRAVSAGKEMLKQLARSEPYYKRNRPHICSFFLKGECNRGDACPFRHEKPADNGLQHQNIQDRYYGRNDPVARKILSQHADSQGLAPPEDKSITSLFLSSLPASTTEQNLRTTVVASIPSVPAAAIKSVVYVEKTRCAFVNFKDRGSAETAAQAWASGLDVEGERISIRWGRSRAAAKPKAPAAEAPAVESST